MKYDQTNLERYHQRVIYNPVTGRRVTLEVYDSNPSKRYHPGNEIFLERPTDLQHLTQEEACEEMTVRMVKAGRI